MRIHADIFAVILVVVACLMEGEPDRSVEKCKTSCLFLSGYDSHQCPYERDRGRSIKPKETRYLQDPLFSLAPQNLRVYVSGKNPVLVIELKNK